MTEDEKGTYTMLFASPHRFGKAMLQAQELALITKGYTDIEIRVRPVKEIELLREVEKQAEYLLDHINRDYFEWAEPLEKALAKLREKDD